MESNINWSEYPVNDELNHGNYIHPTAIIGPNVVMGRGNYIGPLCIIGYPAEHRDYWDADTGKVYIGNNNHLTGLVTVDAGTENETIIGSNCWLLKHSHVGHDVKIFDNVTISCGAKVGGHTIISSSCNLGLNSCIHQRIFIPQGCMIGMGAIVTKKTILEANRKYAGVPAKDIGPNIK